MSARSASSTALKPSLKKKAKVVVVESPKTSTKAVVSRPKARLTSDPLTLSSKDKGKEREHSRLSLFPPINDPDSMFTGSDPHSSPPASPPRPIKRLEFAVPDRPRSASVLQNLSIPQHDAENPFQDDADIAMMVEDDVPQSSQPTIPEEVLAEEAAEFECIDPKEEVKISIYFFGYSLTLTCFSA